jgi:transposase
VIVDVQCTRPECAEIQVDVRMKSSDPYPGCTKCGSPTDRLWTLSRPGDHTSANHASVGFRFNYMAHDA